ncbi:MAG: tetratricopeptide repeat protein [Bacteroidales bacterium]|nr:tetratricopeptide repeat protein [Bacteroidales bacterium]
MKKLTVWIAFVLVCASVYAQPAKKMRHTASNTKEAVTERQITSRFNAGLRAYYTAQYEEAEQAFSGILTVAPKHAPSYYMLARVYAGKQQYMESQNAIKQAVKLDKNNIWYQVALAESYVRTESFKEAIPLWEKICREMPDNLDYLTALTVCYEKNGTADKAAEIRARIGKLSPPDAAGKPSETPVATGDGGYKAQGFNALKSGQYDVAVAQLSQALKEDDTDYDLWSAFAEAVAQSGKWSELTAREEDLTTLFPQSAALLTSLAGAFLKSGNPEKAVEYYKQAKAFAFEPALIQEIKKGLFEAYTAMGDTESAERYR